ncbi:hypothetical protein B0J13DRAFT_503360 [Dactylonectria estremocensis]|uniref:Uncharacterized protein n=1 Tax=Dactylonectria estremocensis TaxID=1079267 RepID=A0A9P9ES78_9HYPO|nr:hypothetical protein B0J13DRAFT_503360 [Dactylonectria estremocensis]
MRLLLLPFLALVALTQAQLESCSKYWPGKVDHPNFLVKGQCQHFPGYPKTFGKTTVRVTYTTSWGKNEHMQDEAAPVLLESITKSIDFYTKWFTFPTEIVIILTDGVDKDETADSSYPKFGVMPCQVRLYKKWTKQLTTKKPRTLQAVAHELYHCIQTNMMGERTKAQDWIIEGSAGYFSNLVFPTANAEWEQRYKPDVPIFSNNPYSGNGFFQSMEPMDPTSINNWVRNTGLADTIPQEKRRLSKLGGFSDEFSTFAQQFSLQAIKDTSGEIITDLEPTKQVPAKISWNKVSTTGTAWLKTVPFTITVFKLSVKPGQTLQLYSSAKGDQRVAYRRPGEKEWKEMPSGPTGGGGKSVMECNDKDTPETILVLFTSTAYAKSDKVKVTLKRRSKDKCVKGQSGFILYPFRNTTTGNLKCPSGTHYTLGNFCCPDGMELDEHAPNRVTVCCPTSADCSKEVFPNNLRCANPTWELWEMDWRQIGCCPKGYYPTSQLYCINDESKKGKFFSRVQTATAAAAPTN